MKYKVVRNEQYDFLKQSYASSYPNLHRYPATMLPQIGIALLNEFTIHSGTLLDPYCGSGSSFAAALEVGIHHMAGFDINPLAVLISRAKFTKIPLEDIETTRIELQKNVFNFIATKDNTVSFPMPKITNMDYWFSKEVLEALNILRHFIYKIDNPDIRRLFLIPYSEIVRICSYTRNNEFKLYRIKPADLPNFKPDTIGLFFSKLNTALKTYTYHYFPKLTEQVKVEVDYAKFEPQEASFDVVLTSPPYGDSKTTVAYGQFSTLSNEWMGIDYARKIDGLLMGGKKAKELYQNGLISTYIQAISDTAHKRALEVSAFYADLEQSISQVARSVKKGGKIMYVVGNRTVKNVQLPTDQFIAEKFENNNCTHLITYKRALSNKVMPSKNSPSNKKGKTVKTMLYEYLVVCEKK